LYKAGRIPYLIADLIAIAFTTGWNYFVSTKYIWKRIDK